MPPSSSDETAGRSSGFDRLHPALQRWIWQQRWTSLRDVQERAIPPILEARLDVLISAATAGGKTEAALLPALTRLASREAQGVRLLLVSPLKALINDQFRRLESIGTAIDTTIHRWHGDVAQAQKSKLLKDPCGVLLITPESLEALFVRRGTLLRTLFAGLEFAVIDELHAFVGTERGRQLQSLLHRLELVLRRRVPRIGLSATLGDLRLAAGFLRPGGGSSVVQVNSTEEGGEVKVQVRGYLDPIVKPEEVRKEPATSSSFRQIVGHVFDKLRGQRNLIFINAKSQVEAYADGLRTLSELRRVPNEFHPHHGSLSKGLREDVERLLKEGDAPISAICTSTLELGIDIGDVESVAQIGAPPSVASLRQRLGRSGRRGSPAVLRIYVDEPEVGPKTPFLDTLRLETVQSVAMVRLLVERWFEPPVDGALHLSTLVQQVLSTIAQLGGARAKDLWVALCRDGPFHTVDSEMFVTFLRGLGERQLLVQNSEGLLLLGTDGERLVNHYDFYSAFSGDEEYRIEHDGRLLGSIPISHSLIPGQMLIFAGRRWTVRSVDEEQKRVAVSPAQGGSPPRYSGGGAKLHDRVRVEMFRLYSDGESPAFLDTGACELLRQGRRTFQECGLLERRIVTAGDDANVFLWAGDRVLDTVVALLATRGVSSIATQGCVIAGSSDERAVISHFEAILSEPPQDARMLASAVRNKRREKHDGFLVDELLCADYASRDLDVTGARKTLEKVLNGLSPLSA